MSTIYEECPECGSNNLDDTEIWDAEEQIEYWPVLHCDQCGWTEDVSRKEQNED